MRFQKTIEVLDQITDLSRALRQGGPDPMDLQELSDALEEAVYLAKDEMERLIELIETRTSGQYPSEQEIIQQLRNLHMHRGNLRAVIEDGTQVARLRHDTHALVMWACDWAADRQREKDAQICEGERVDAEETGATEDVAYNLAIEHCAEAIRSQDPSADADKKANLPIELKGVAEAAAYRVGFWKSCTGCHELNEGHDTGPYSMVFGCALGNGCSECGGIGAVWDTTDYKAMARALAHPAQAQEPSHTYLGANVAERLDSMADDQPSGSQAQSDLYAAATAWRKHAAPAQADPITVGRSALARWELAMTRSLGEYPVPLLAERSVKEMRAFLGVQTQRELLKNSQQFPSPTGCPGSQAQPTGKEAEQCKACHGTKMLIMHGHRGVRLYDYPCPLCAQPTREGE